MTSGQNLLSWKRRRLVAPYRRGIIGGPSSADSLMASDFLHWGTSTMKNAAHFFSPHVRFSDWIPSYWVNDTEVEQGHCAYPVSLTNLLNKENEENYD